VEERLLHFQLNRNRVINILLFDPGTPNVQIGWSFLVYDSVNTRLGGYAIFQQILSAGTFEALVPPEFDERLQILCAL
jgi:hypothetical protein